MNSDEFRRHGHQVVDWIADYLSNVRDYPVLSRNQPGELTDSLPAHAPESGDPMETILADFERQIVPALTHWNHPGFLGYFAISGSPPGILAEMLAAGLNVNGMLWKSSPAVAELEQVTLGWLREWLGLPPEFFGIVYDTASTSTLHALACARESIDPDSRLRGALGNLTVYCSELAHSSIEKGAISLGFGQNNVRKIPVDAQFRLRPEALEAAIAGDRAAGLVPCCIVATVGTTGVASVDPVPAVARIARREGIWLHVDAAYGGAVALTESRRHLMEGVELADSLVFNPHKWLLTPVDLSAFYTRRPEILRRAFSLIPEYLRSEDNPRATNLMDYGFQLGRRFRSLKLWFVMRSYGRQGLARIIEDHCEMAVEFANRIQADPDFELAAPVLFSLVCFRYKGANEQNQNLLETINAAGSSFLSHTVVDGHFVLRLAIGNFQTSRADLDAVWEQVKSWQRAAAR